MTLANSTKSSESESLGSPSQPLSAKKISFKNRVLAKRRFFYAFYLAIDSSKLSSSTIKYMFDIYFANVEFSTKKMNEWMATSQGLATVVTSATLFIAVALFSNHKRDEKNKNNVVVAWPYARDAMKALRNTYRGIQSTLMLVTLLDIQDLQHLIAPISVCLGAVVVMNRIWFRATAAQRTAMMESNQRLLDEVMAVKELTLSQIQEFTDRMQLQSPQLNTGLLYSSVFSGIVEGLNPYIGTLAVGALTPQLLGVITVFCAVYFLATLSSKIYDELKAQDKALALQNKILNKLIYNSQPLKDEEDPAVMTGIKNGLAGYKYVMLSLSLVLFLSPVKIKSMAPIHRAILGGASLVMALAVACNPFRSKQKLDAAPLVSNDKSKGLSAGGHADSFFASSQDETTDERLGLASLSFVQA